MINGILLGISVLANIFLFGMLTFVLGQRRKDKKFMVLEMRKGIDQYLELTFKALDERMKNLKDFADEKSKD